MNIFLQAAAAVFTPSALFFMLVGTFFGILCGAMPGSADGWECGSG